MEHSTFFCVFIVAMLMLYLAYVTQTQEHFGNEVIVVNAPLLNHSLALAVDEANEVVSKKLPMLPQNVIVEIHDRNASKIVNRWAMLKVDDSYHMSKVVRNNPDKHMLVSVLPNTSALCHLCFVVRATNKEFMYIEDLNVKHDTIGVLRLEDVPLVQDVLKACNITKPKKFEVIKLPVNNAMFEKKGVTCAALFCDLDGVKDASMGKDDVRLNFLQYDHVMNKDYMMSKYPFMIQRNFDMRLFFPAANLTSNFPVVSCTCFEYLIFMMNSNRVVKDTGMPEEQVHQLVDIIARRIENYDAVNMYLMEFKAYPAILPLLKRFDQRWNQLMSQNDDGTGIH